MGVIAVNVITTGFICTGCMVIYPEKEQAEGCLCSAEYQRQYSVPPRWYCTRCGEAEHLSEKSCFSCHFQRPKIER